MQKNSSVHLFIRELQSILECRDQTGHTHFWPSLPKKIQLTLNFREFASTWKNKTISTISSGYTVDLKIL